MLALPREEIVSVEIVNGDFECGYATALTVKTLTLNEVRDYMCLVVDGHRMVQTVNYADQYTGDWYYEAWSHKTQWEVEADSVGSRSIKVGGEKSAD